MNKKISLLLAAIMVVNTVATVAHGAFQNPLKNYNLYEDVNPSSTDERERVISDYLGKPNNASVPNMDDFSSYNRPSTEVPDAPKSRNQTLRDSSLNIYSDPSSTPGWLEGPSYYSNASFASIVEKYRKSDFAGCLQECISYVRQHPNDTLGYYYLAMCYTKCSDKDNAIKAYEKVIALNDNPMIVKYATNGRNCVMDNENEKCYPNVNEPELVYPYANIPVATLQPIDPETLVNRNLSTLATQLSPIDIEGNNNEYNNSNDKDSKNKKIILPFGKQDAELDAFINSPYGNGFSADLNKQYKQLQLKRIQNTINVGDYSEKDNQQNINEIKKFDNQKSDAGTIKLAYLTEEDWAEIKKDPEFIKSQNELREISAILGSDNKKESNDFSDMLPYMDESNAQKLSPEMIQNMMLKSLMGDITL